MRRPNTLTLPAEALSFSDMPSGTNPDITSLGNLMYATYEQSVHGIWHSAQALRYEGGFGSYGRKQMLRDFGDSAHPIRHMRATGASFMRLIGELPPSAVLCSYDIEVGFAAAMIHDIGECTFSDLKEICGGVVGDIPFGKKTEADRELESRIRRALYDKYYRRHGIPDETIDRTETIIAHKEESLTHKTLEADHDTNGFIDGLRTGTLAFESPNEDSARQRQLVHMATIITANTIGLVEKHSNVHPPIRRILDESEPILDRIQQEFGAAA